MSAWVTVAPMVGLDTAGLEKTKKLLDTQPRQQKVGAKMQKKNVCDILTQICLDPSHLAVFKESFMIIWQTAS